MQLFGFLVTPFLTRSPDQVASRIALGQAAVFENVDLLAGATTDVSAAKAADGPARRFIGSAEVQEVLLGLVACQQHHSVLGKEAVASGFHVEEALESVDAGSRALPFHRVLPLECRLHGLGHAPTVGEAELG